MKSENRKTLAFLFLLLGGFAVNFYGQTAKPDYTSKVPKYAFASTLEKQEEQLKTNPLLARFRQSRKTFATEKYRPLYHFVSPEGNMNDPNGLCFWKGRWHLFYQAYPPDDPRQHWGHAVSNDLIHWQDLPYAIYPNPEYQSFSGSTLVESDRVIAMYHGTRLGNMVATASDPLLLNWNKILNGAVIPLTSDSTGASPYTVFDPTLWRKDTTYYSLSAGKSSSGVGNMLVRADYLFRSKDLIKWEYLHEFVKNDRFTQPGDDGACPYFLPIGKRYIMPFFSHRSGGQYLLGDYDKTNDMFMATAHGKFNFGAAAPSGVHAPSATIDGNGNVIILFNMNPGKNSGKWDQIMTLPRKLTLIGEDTVGMIPAGDIASLRYRHQHIANLSLPANKEIVLKNIKGNASEFIVEIQTASGQTVEMNVLRSANKQEYTRIVFFPQRGFHQGRPYQLPRPKDWQYKFNSIITLETSGSSISPDVFSRPPENAQVYIPPGENVTLHVFIDKSVVEVFVNGRQCIAARVYPGRDDSTGVSFLSHGKDSKLISFDGWQMKSIYNEAGQN